MNIHENIHCPLKPREQVATNKKQKKECEHVWRLLRPVGVEGKALQDGFKEVCEKCQSLQ